MNLVLKCEESEGEGLCTEQRLLLIDQFSCRPGLNSVPQDLVAALTLMNRYKRISPFVRTHVMETPDTIPVWDITEHECILFLM